ncbi:MAG: Kelch repeat-containing protein, partial [Planctomycetota bacterium]
LHIGGTPGVDGIKFPDGSVQTTASGWTAPGGGIFYTTGSVGIGTDGPIYAGDTIDSDLTPLPSGRHALACATDLATGMIYCFGGYDGNALDDIVEYDPRTDTLVTMPTPLPTPRRDLACAAYPATGKIYCFGGIDAGYLADIVEYDPRTDTCITKQATLPSGRERLACAADSATRKIYCFGGYDGHTFLDEIIEYDPRIPDVMGPIPTKSAKLPWGRRALACTANPATGRIYCLGGWGGSRVRQIVEYDPVNDTRITKYARLPSGTFGLACTADSATGKIYCLGGDDGTFLRRIVEYDPGIPDVPGEIPIMGVTLDSGRRYLACAAYPTTRGIYCFAGDGGTTLGLLDEIVEYDPPLNTRLQVGEPGDGWGAIANHWSVFSSRAFKRDIEPLRAADYHDILAKLLGTDVVRYRCIQDARQAPHLGVIAEDSPAEILSPDGKAVSLADYAAFLLAAIKAQQAELTEKNRRIDDMGSELAETQARLATLEALVADLRRMQEGGAR